nr:peptide-methionine (R)-S-oxide reductase [Sphingomonas sp.]
MNDRRTFLGLAGLTGAGLLLFGRSTRANATFAVTHSPAEWRRMLGPQRYAVLREAATERPFTSPLNKEHRRGTFSCAGCRLPLFSSATKF